MAYDMKITHDNAVKCAKLGCINDPMEGATKCGLHGGSMELQKANKAEIRSYMVAKWNSKLDRFHKADNIRSLREEIAIARMTLESILLKCDNEYDILLYSGKITNVIDTIRRLVTDCNRIEDRLGYTLDKSATINLAEKLVMIVGNFINDDQLPEVAKQMANAIAEANSVIDVTDDEE